MSGEMTKEGPARHLLRLFGWIAIGIGVPWCWSLSLIVKR